MNPTELHAWLQDFKSGTPNLSKPLIMGVINVTPDSFSDGGVFIKSDDAYRQAMTLLEQGADILDIGGESSRPGAISVPLNEELARVIPVIKQIRASSDVCISIDTCKAEVMKEAVDSGASIINDINALQDVNALKMVADLNTPVCLMHMQGVPRSMQNNPYYEDVVDEVNRFFKQRIRACVEAGIARNKLILDPGFGFGKTTVHNLQLLKRMAFFQQHKLPILLGVSRKSTLGVVLQKKVSERVIGGITAAVYAMINGASIIRTHDVDEMKQACKILNAIDEVV